jgi:hypothetical protein
MNGSQAVGKETVLGSFQIFWGDGGFKHQKPPQEGPLPSCQIWPK